MTVKPVALSYFDFDDLDPTVADQLMAAMGLGPSPAAQPAAPSALDLLHDMQEAALKRIAADAPTPVQEPPTAVSSKLDTDHPVIAAMLLSAVTSADHAPQITATDSGVRIRLEGNLYLLVNMKLWTMRYQVGDQVGPLRAVRRMTDEEQSFVLSFVEATP